MEELGARLGELLGSAEGMEQLAGLLSSLGMGEETAIPASPNISASREGPDIGALLGMLGSLTGGDRLPGGKGVPSAGIDPSLLTRIMQIMSRMNEPDRNTQLLQALAPFCGERRQKRVEEAAQLLRILRLLPLLEGEQGEG